MLHLLLNKITALGEASEMLPLAVLLLLCLLLEQAWDAAKAWAIILLLSMALVLASKIAFAGWGIGWSRFNFIGISGHTMLATLMLASSAYMLARPWHSRVQHAAIACGMALGIVVGASRMLLHMHSFSEVVAGWVLGCAAAISFARICRRLRPFSHRPAIVMAAAYVLVLAMGDYPLPTQRWINAIAQQLSGRPVAYYRTIPLP